MDPEVVLISVGRDSLLRHPHREMLERLEAHAGQIEDGLQVYRTDEDGTVEIVSDGRAVRVETGQ